MVIKQEKRAVKRERTKSNNALEAMERSKSANVMDTTKSDNDISAIMDENPFGGLEQIPDGEVEAPVAPKKNDVLMEQIKAARESMAEK